jgi:hypothetical protein
LRVDCGQLWTQSLEDVALKGEDVRRMSGAEGGRMSLLLLTALRTLDLEQDAVLRSHGLLANSSEGSVREKKQVISGTPAMIGGRSICTMR